LGVGDGGLDDLPDRLLLDARQELLGDVELDVGLQEGEANVAQGLIEVLLGQLGHAGQAVAGCPEALAQSLEHSDSFVVPRKRAGKRGGRGGEVARALAPTQAARVGPPSVPLTLLVARTMVL